jgi:hypothetical protein
MKSSKITKEIRKDPPIQKEDPKNENVNNAKIEKENKKTKKMKIKK